MVIDKLNLDEQALHKPEVNLNVLSLFINDFRYCLSITKMN